MTDTTVSTPELVTPSRQQHAEGRAGRRRRRTTLARTIGRHAALAAGAIVMVYPLLWLLASSFKPNNEIFNNLGLIPQNFTLQNYVKGWTALQYPFWVFMLNSTIVAVGCIVGNLISCSLAAYAFARLKFRWRGVLFAVMLITIMLPSQVVLIPQFIIFKQLGWLDTFLPLIVPKFFATDAFFIFLMVQFIRALPNELYEAARVDGAGQFRLYWQITLPLMLPALATTGIFTFVWTWNDFFSPLLYLREPSEFTAPLALNQYLSVQSLSNYGSMFAMSVLSLLPLFAAFLIGQKYLIRGFATTGLK